MMNKRTGVQAEFASGETETYLRHLGASGSHMLLEHRQSHILLRRDVATRETAFHEWLHRYIQFRRGFVSPDEDAVIRRFLARHRRWLRLDE